MNFCLINDVFINVYEIYQDIVQRNQALKCNIAYYNFIRNIRKGKIAIAEIPFTFHIQYQIHKCFFFMLPK